MAEEATTEVKIANSEDLVPEMPTIPMPTTPHGIALTVIIHIVK